MVTSSDGNIAPRWLDQDEMAAWLRLVAIVELLPGVLDTQLRRDAELNHFEYFVMAILSEAPGRTLRMTVLAQNTNATLTRLSHVVRRLEERELVQRTPCPEDARATNAHLTDLGMVRITEAAPGHVANVRAHVIDALTPDQISSLTNIADSILSTLDPEGRVTALYDRTPAGH